MTLSPTEPARVTLPGQSSTKARVLHHLPDIRYAWLDGTISTQPPVSVEVHLTNACNLRCVFCSYGRVRAGEMLTPEALGRLLDDLCACAPTLKAVVFSGGGEPSLHPGLPEAIHRLRDAEIEIGVITNGVRLTGELLEAYLRCSWVRVSLDSPDPEHYAQVLSPHSPRNYRRVLDNLTQLSLSRRARSDSRLITGIGYVVDRHIQHDEALIRCLEIAAEVGADYIAYRPLIATPHLQITRPLEELAALEPFIRQHATRLGVGQQFAKFVGTFSKATTGQPLARDAHCPVVSDGLIAFVAATGDVLPCYAHFMNGRTTRFGNITRDRFCDIWAGPLRQQVARAIDAARTCPFCRYHSINAMLWNQADQKLDVPPQPTPGYDEHSRLPDMGFTRDDSDPHWMFL